MYKETEILSVVERAAKRLGYTLELALRDKPAERQAT